MPEEQVSPETAQLLFELAPRLTRLENAVLKALAVPLTFRQYRLLARVQAGSSTLTELRAPSTLTLAAVSESVDGLVQRGLLARQVAVDDRRAVRISITEEGRAAVLDAAAALHELASDLVEDLRTHDAGEVHRLLADVVDQVTSRLRDPASGAPTQNPGSTGSGRDSK